MSAFSGDFDQGPLVDPPAQAPIAELPIATGGNGHAVMVDGRVETTERRVGTTVPTSIRYIPLPSDYESEVQNLRTFVQSTPHIVESRNIQADIGTGHVVGILQEAPRVPVPNESRQHNLLALPHRDQFP